MDAIASQITSLTIVYSTVYSDADQRKHQSSASLAFRRIHRWPVNSPHKWPVTRKMFPFDDVIMICSNDSLAPNGRQVVMGANGGIVYRSIYTRPEWVETPNSGTIFISSVPLETFSLDVYLLLSGRTSYRKSWLSLEAARFGCRLFQSHWKLAGSSTAVLPRCLSNVTSIRSL